MAYETILYEKRGRLPTWKKRSEEDRKVLEHLYPKAPPSVNDLITVEEAARNDAEQKGGLKLGVPAFAVALAAYKLWGQSLTEEREK